jgi:hypothetical protein
MGIGAASPGSKLDVEGPAEESEANYKTSTTYAQMVLCDSDTSTSGLKIGYRYQSGVTEYARIQAFNSANGTPISINPNGGSVGIGCTSPDVKLRVEGTVKFGTPSANNSNVLDIIGFKNGDGARTWQIGFDNSNSNFLLQQGNNAFGTDADAVLSIYPNGNVGVGVPSPAEKLDVNGAICIKDGMTAPSTHSGKASIYIDSADGDLKIKFGDGTVKTIVTD